MSKTTLQSRAIWKIMSSFSDVSGDCPWNDVFALREIDVCILRKEVEGNDVNFILVWGTDNRRRIQENAHVPAEIAVADAPHFLGGGMQAKKKETKQDYSKSHLLSLADWNHNGKVSKAFLYANIFLCIFLEVKRLKENHSDSCRIGVRLIYLLVNIHRSDLNAADSPRGLRPRFKIRHRNYYQPMILGLKLKSYALQYQFLILLLFLQT
jgi:hypothetical protein